MELNENTRNDFRQKWNNLIQIVDRYENSSAEELAMAYFLIDSVSERIKHTLRHRLDQQLVGRLEARLQEQMTPGFPKVVMPGIGQRMPSPRCNQQGENLGKTHGLTNVPRVVSPGRQTQGGLNLPGFPYLGMNKTRTTNIPTIPFLGGNQGSLSGVNAVM